MALRKLKRVHKKLLAANKYDKSSYLLMKETRSEIVFFSLVTKTELTFSKNQGLFC